jgi:hypothetical protein
MFKSIATGPDLRAALRLSRKTVLSDDEDFLREAAASSLAASATSTKGDTAKPANASQRSVRVIVNCRGNAVSCGF